MTDHTAFYATAFKSWQKGYGSKPTGTMFEHVHGLGCRPGKQALATAMGLRPEGVTNPQVLLVCGNPQNNKRAGLVYDGYLKREAVPNSPEGHTVYKYTVTPKGLKRVESVNARAAALEAAGKATGEADKAKPVKVKAAAKPAKKATKGKKPRVTVVPGTVTEPVADTPVEAMIPADTPVITDQPAV
jgi:hypothetical protein